MAALGISSINRIYTNHRTEKMGKKSTMQGNMELGNEGPKNNMSFPSLSINTRNSGGLFCSLLFNSEGTTVKLSWKKIGPEIYLEKIKGCLVIRTVFLEATQWNS